MNGMIAWFARNSVAANLLMVFIIACGLIASFSVNSEPRPEISTDRINIEVPYLGAAPEEVEQAVCVRLEEAIQGLEGIEQITSTASEGMGSVLVELEQGADARRVMDDIKGRVEVLSTWRTRAGFSVGSDLNCGVTKHTSPRSTRRTLGCGARGDEQPAADGARP